MAIEKIDISKIMVENTYRTKLSENDKAIYLVDIPKASQIILDLINKEIQNVTDSKNDT